MARTARTATASTGSARSRTATRAARRRAPTTRTTRPTVTEAGYTSYAGPGERRQPAARRADCRPSPRASTSTGRRSRRSSPRRPSTAGGADARATATATVACSPTRSPTSRRPTPCTTTRRRCRTCTTRSATSAAACCWRPRGRRRCSTSSAQTLGTDDARRGAECLAGAWAANTSSSLSPGDLDEAVTVLVAGTAQGRRRPGHGLRSGGGVPCGLQARAVASACSRADSLSPARARLRGVCNDAHAPEFFRCAVLAHRSPLTSLLRCSPRIRGHAGASRRSDPSTEGGATTWRPGRTTVVGRVLVAEDDKSVRDSLVRALTLRGLRRRHRGRRHRGAAWPCSTSQPDVIVLDVLMPARRRPHRVPPPARARRPHAGADAHRPPRGERPGRRARRRRRRLPREAVRARRAARAPARAAAAHEHVRRRRGAARRRPLARSRSAGRRGAATASSSSPRPSSTCSSCSCSTPASSLTREQIYERIWGFDFETSSKSLDVYIGYLRRKTEDGGRIAPHPHRAGSRVHGPTVMSLRTRLTVDRGGDRRGGRRRRRVRRARERAATRCATRPTSSCATAPPASCSGRPATSAATSAARRPTTTDDGHGRYFEFDAVQQIIDRDGTVTNSSARAADAARSTPRTARSRAAAAQSQLPRRHRRRRAVPHDHRVAARRRRGADRPRGVGDRRRPRRAAHTGWC